MRAFYESIDGNDISVTESKGTYPLHFHTSVEILYCLDGELTVLVGGEKLTAKKGEFVFFDENDVHAVLSSKFYLTVLIPPVFLREYLSFMHNKTVKSHIFADDGEVYTLIQKIVSDNQNGRLYQIGLAITLLGKITALATIVNKQTYLPDDMKKVPLYVQEHFTQKISLSSLAQALGYNKYYLSKAFKDYFGENFNEYLTSLRLNHFLLLMETENVAVTDAVYESGFSSLQTFYRVFKKKYGCSPTAYLKKIGYTTV